MSAGVVGIGRVLGIGSVDNLTNDGHFTRIAVPNPFLSAIPVAFARVPR